MDKEESKPNPPNTPKELERLSSVQEDAQNFSMKSGPPATPRPPAPQAQKPVQAQTPVPAPTQSKKP